jgi:hypothetical protein
MLAAMDHRPPRDLPAAPRSTSGLARSAREPLGAVLALLIATVGCGPEGSGLYVDLRTDLAPGREFVGATVELSTAPFEDGSPTLGDSREHFARGGGDYVQGLRIAEYPGLAERAYWVRVVLSDASGRPGLGRIARVEVRGATQLTVVITRNCRDVSCPSPGGDPQALACVGGSCVAPDCRPETPENCPTPACSDDAQCPATSPCALGRCLAGTCLAPADDSLCGAGFVCGGEDGCVPGVAEDAGAPPSDAGALDASDADASVGDDDAGLDAGSCAPREESCDDAADDDCDGEIDCADGDCDGATCDASGRVCSAGSCACAGGSVEADCADGLDGDCDGNTDCVDDDCDGAACDASGRACSGVVCACPGGAAETRCDDGLDEDCDGAADCADSDCDAARCDASGRVCAAGGCACPGGSVERACSGGLDDDCDGASDCADSDCAGVSCGAGALVCLASECACPSGPERDCSDTVDDDCDGAVDCEDSDCNGQACDDGYWCNGADVCSAGTCSGHPAPPCPTFCSEKSRACVACLVDEDCGAPTGGPWSGCTYAQACDETNGASEARDVMVPTCSAGMCTTTIRPESRACSRDTDGVSCGGVTFGDWSACGDYADGCDEAGTQARSVLTPLCSAGVCETAVTSQTQACARDTDGVGCGATTCDAFGSCGGYTSTCDETGTQSRTCTDRVCSAGSCAGVARSESQSCTRSTMGVTCDVTTCGSYGSCGGYASTCDETGSQSRTCTDYECAGGGCAPQTRSESRGCTRSTTGLMCSATTCGAWGTCGSYTSTCDETGTQTRTCTDYECGSGSCGGVSRTESRACTRSTTGTSCNTTTYGSWSTCSYADVCDESASQSRSVTTYTCGGGNCDPSSSTQTQSCATRNTDGVRCGRATCPDFCAAGICEYGCAAGCFC